MNSDTSTSIQPTSPAPVEGSSQPSLQVANPEAGPAARSERVKLLPFPRPLKVRQIRALQRLVDGSSRATNVPLATLLQQIAAMTLSFDLTNGTRQSLQLLALDMEGFLQRFDPSTPFRCAASILWLRNAMDEIVQLQASSDTVHLPFRMFNATLIAVGLEIIRCLDLQLSAASTVGNPLWQQEPGIPKLRRHRVAAKTSVTLAPRMEWSSSEKRIKAN